jgi:pimeloyl-ACP methyl ester carboxylesterase
MYKRNDWSMHAFALDVDAVLKDLGTVEAVLVGFSMGGAVAIELASLNRQYVKGVVLVDILQDPEWRPDDAFIDEAAKYEREMWGNEDYIASEFSDGASRTLVQRYLSRTPETVPAVWWDSLRELLLWIRKDSLEKVALVDVPVFAINSPRELTNVDAWNRIAPGFRVHVIEGVGHLGMIWERVEEFDQVLLEYLNQLEQ